MAINWNNIRIHQGSQDQGFEELCCQLFQADPPIGQTRYDRRGYRDAGLECVHVLRDGSMWGMQAKYFIRSPSPAQWRDIDQSVRTALSKNPTLIHMTICLPQNFDDPQIPKKLAAMDRWRKHADSWEKLAAKQKRGIKFELWGDSELTERLGRLENQGKLWYFFNHAVLTSDWFRNRIDEVSENAKPRYSEELNVDLPIAQLFEGLGRTPDFEYLPSRLQDELRKNIQSLNSPRPKTEDAMPVVEEAIACGQAVIREISIIDWCEDVLLPLERIAEQSRQLRDKAREASSVLEDLDREQEKIARAEWEAGERHGSFHKSQEHAYQRHLLWEISSISSELHHFATSKQACLASNACLLVEGSAGVGKTHLLVDVAKRRVALGLPTILFLGQDFEAGKDPLTQIIEKLGLRLEREQFLQALATAGETSGGRALLMIDALNEGEGLKLWPKQLPGFLLAINRYPKIGVAFSVRTTYLDDVVPEHVLSRAIRTTHDGFASKPEVAARAFFTHYGINLPKIPLLNPEYNNPLFLKLLCQGLNKAGQHDIPEGSEGIGAVFDFLIEATENKLKTEGTLNTASHEHPVKKFLDRLVDELGLSGRDALAKSKADAMSHEIYRHEGFRGSILDLLLRESLLSCEMMLTQDGVHREEGVRFAYQRLGDYQIARRLLDLHIGEDVAAAFSPSGVLGQFFARQQDYYHYKGVLEALSILVPERFGRELLEVLAHPQDDNAPWAYNHVLHDCLLNSLLWRKKSTLSKKTLKVIHGAITTRGDNDRWIEILLTLSAIPDHPLNANYLHTRLLSMSLPKRDEAWTMWLYSHYEDEGAVDRLLAWGLLLDDRSHLADNAILLACTSIAWLTAATVRTIRDRATKALVNLLTTRPHLISSLLSQFSEVDDPYVTERLYATAYGVSMRNSDPVALKLLAEAMHAQLFSCRPPIEHVMVRDYARCVVERASYAGCNLSFDIKVTRPPYGSDVPPEPPSRECFEKRLPRKKGWTDRDRAISFVVNRFGDNDMSKYLGGPSLQNPGFTGIRLSDKPAKSRQQIKKQWQAGLNKKQRDLLQSLTLLCLKQRVQVVADPPQSRQIGDSEFAAAEAAFTRSLTPLQKKSYHGSILGVGASDGDGLPSLPRDLFARYVVDRALRLGWTAGNAHAKGDQGGVLMRK